MSSHVLYDNAVPVMSVVLATPGGFNAVRLTLAHLHQQSIRHQLELIIVMPVGQQTSIPPEGRDFARLCVVELEAVRSVGQGNAAGVRAASAPIVALAEDHAFPEPEWAAALWRAHQVEARSVVAPALRNANPRSAVSRADFLLGYGPWAMPVAANEHPFLPGHNSSYKRNVLLALGGRLEEALTAETVLHWELRNSGHCLWLEPQAQLRHINFALWKSWLRFQFHQGRVFAAARTAHWQGTKCPLRWLYALASPLIVGVRLWRAWRDLRRVEAPGMARTRTLAALLVGLVFDALGQGVGAVAGAGDAEEQFREFDRLRHITPYDRQQWREQEAALCLANV